MNPQPPPLVYVAGPITGNPWGCVRQAVALFPELRAAGVVPFFPQLSILHEVVTPVAYQDWLAYDLDVIRNAAALIRLPGHSEGADREVDFANELGLPVFHFDDVQSRDAFHRWARGGCQSAEHAGCGCPKDACR